MAVDSSLVVSIDADTKTFARTQIRALIAGVRVLLGRPN